MGGYDDSQFQQKDTETKKKQNNVSSKCDNFLIAFRLALSIEKNKKMLTIVQNLPEDLDLKKILRSFKKSCCCNGVMHKHEEWGAIL